jgi:hypothetical protein
MSTTLPETPTIPIAPPENRPVAELLAELEELSDPDLIAEAFADEDILGTPCNAGICALAIYLQRHSGLDELNVGTFEVSRWQSGELADERWNLGPVVQEFIARFDSGSYPHLLWPEERIKWADDTPWA